MCLAKSKPECAPLYDAEDGSVIQEDNLEIPQSIHEHIDNVFLNFDGNSDEGILAFIYKAGNEIFIVWTSDEALELVYEPFSEIADLPEFELL